MKKNAHKNEIMGSIYRSNKRRYSIIMLVCILVVISTFLIYCGDGIDSGPNIIHVHENIGWITIDYPTSEPNYTENSCPINLKGEAFICPQYSDGCPNWYGRSGTGVDVTWENKTIGMSGDASQHARTCYSYLCEWSCGDHTWEASVPLESGENIIVVTALDAHDNIGTASIAVTKPESVYSILGSVMSIYGLDLGGFGEVSVEIRGDNIEPITYASHTRIYQFNCIPDGTYTITPTGKNMNFVFDPMSSVVTVSNSSLSGIDFIAEASFISGYIRDSNGIGVSTSIQISGTGGTTTVRSSPPPLGFYRFIVPNGTYTISSGGDYILDPESITLTVSNESISNLNFIAYQ